MRPIDADALKENMKFSSVMYDRNGIVHVPLKDIDTAIDNAPTVGEWISVKERLPESSGIKVIVSAKTIPESALQTKAVFVAFLGYGDGKWYTPDVDFMASEKTGNHNVHPVWEITHWRFPPEPSKEEE